MSNGTGRQIAEWRAEPIVTPAGIWEANAWFVLGLSDFYWCTLGQPPLRHRGMSKMLQIPTVKIRQNETHPGICPRDLPCCLLLKKWAKFAVRFKSKILIILNFLRLIVPHPQPLGGPSSAAHAQGKKYKLHQSSLAHEQKNSLARKRERAGVRVFDPMIS